MAERTIDGVTRRAFLKTMGAVGGGMLVGLNPFAPSESRASSDSNIYVASDGTKIDVTHLGRKNWNEEQKAVLEDCNNRYKAADYPDIPKLWESFAKKVGDYPELHPILGGMNSMINLASGKESLYHKFNSLIHENIEYMKTFNKRFINNPVTEFEVGFGYDSLDVEAHGEGVKHMEKAIILAKKLPKEYLFHSGIKPMCGELDDTLRLLFYSNLIRGPPTQPVTWKSKVNIRGPPYDTAYKALKDALQSYPDNEYFKKELNWVKARV